MKTIFHLVNVLIFFSCSKQGSEKFYHKQAQFTINIEDPTGKTNEQSSYMSTYIDTCFYVALETNNKEYIGEISQIKIFNDTIFIQDKQTKSFFIFNMKGELIKRIRSIGKGPSQYIDIHDFTIDKVNKELILLDNISLNCLVYSLDGKFINKDKLKIHASRFTWLENNCYAVYNDYNRRLKNDRFNLFFTDFSGKIVERAFPFPKEAFESRLDKWNYFFESNGSMFFLKYYDNTIYKISADTIISHIHFNFGKHKLPENTYYGNYNIDKQYVHTLTNYFETSRTKVLHYTFSNKRIMLLVDNENSKHRVYTRGRSWTVEPAIDYCYFLNTVGCVYKDYFCTDVGIQSIKNRLKELELNMDSDDVVRFNKLEAVQDLKSKNSMDNPVLFFYKTKEF